MECKEIVREWRFGRAEGFNRDIVECKAGSRMAVTRRGDSDLIETLWNVKLIDHAGVFPGVLGI